MAAKIVRKFLGCDEVLTDMNMWKALFAEFVGTLFLVLFGCGSCIKWTLPVDVVQIALAFGLSVASMVQCICHVSGGHINPAVTFGMLAIGKISLVRALFYIISQCVGSIVASALLKAVTPVQRLATLGLTTLHDDVTMAEAFGIEFLITFALVFTVCSVCDQNRTDIKGSAPLAIGLIVATCHLFALNYTGCGMNPARTFGPALISNVWSDHWIYWIGPCLGGISSAVLYHFAFRAPVPVLKEEFIKKEDTLIREAEV